MNLIPGAEISCLLSVLERVRLKGFFFFLKNLREFFRNIGNFRIRETSLPRGLTVPFTPPLHMSSSMCFRDALNCYPFFNDLSWQLLLRQFTTGQSTQIPVGARTFFCTTDFRQPKVDIFPHIGSCAISKININACAFVYLETFHFSPPLQEVTWSVHCLIFTM